MALQYKALNKRLIKQTAVWCLISLLSIVTTLSAQPLSTTLCAPRGTPYPSNKQQIPLPQVLTGSTATAYVPLRLHIFRRSNGSGGITLPVLNDALAALNRQFLLYNTGIQFFFSGSQPHYIDSDEIYLGRTQPSVAMDSSDVSNALNNYFRLEISNSDFYTGVAYYPEDSKLATRVSYRVSELFTSSRHLGETLMCHELGHSFNLIHTFGVRAEGYTDELVTRGAGANCDRAGDLLCDTPADPYGYPTGNDAGYDANNCPYYIGTARDANGELYTPDATNIMGYFNSFPRVHCPYNFSPGQVNRMREGLAIRQGFKNVTLDAPAMVMLAPSNVQTTTTSTGHIMISWQDNATNEAGYLIERSTTSTDGFIPIAGVGPNITTWTDATVKAQTVYYYRIRPSNTTTGALSSVMAGSSTTLPCQPYSVFGCETGIGLANFQLNNTFLSKQTHCSPLGYGTFSSVVKYVQPGQRSSFQLDLLTGNRTVQVNIFLDKNRNNSYEAEELIASGQAERTPTFAGDFTIPTGIDKDPIGLRVMTSQLEVPASGCSNVLWGETEDYRLIVGEEPVCTAMTSVKSGAWNDITVWSCGRLPVATDNLRIDPAHTITLDETMAEALCHSLDIQGTFSMQGGSLVIDGNVIQLDQTNVTTR